MTLFSLRNAEIAFEGGSVDSGGAPLRYEVEQCGHLILGAKTLFRRIVGATSIVAADPWVPAIQPGPIIDVVPTGKHLVSVAFAHLANGHRALAYLRVQFSTNKVVGWRHALTESDDSARRRGESFGYGVDSGFGCVMGTQAAEHMARRLSDEGDKLETEVLDAMAPDASGMAATWALIEPSPDCSENVLVVQSGFGDGIYCSYLGIDDRDLIACMVTDFKVRNVELSPAQISMQKLMALAPKLEALQKAREAAAPPRTPEK